MLDTIDNARSELEAALADLERQSSDRGDLAQGEARTQLRSLAKLRDQLVAGANGMPPAAIRAEVTAAVAAIHAYASDARGAASSPASVKDAELARLNVEARASITAMATDLFERRIFDPYLRFTSPDEEEEYRRREADRRSEIDRLLARDTPQATLQALDVTIAQMNDAGEHGADASPEFERRLNEATRQRDALAVAMGEPERSEVRNQPQPASDDPFAAVQAAIDPAIIASLASTGITASEGEGHGVHLRNGSDRTADVTPT